MLTQLARPESARVAPLLSGLDHQLSVAAVLAGTMPGLVLVDDAARANAVFLHSPEGNFVGGEPTNGFVTDLRAHLAGAFVPERDGDLVISFDHEGWTSSAPRIAPDLTLSTVPRRHYLFRAEQPRPRPEPPAGYRLVPIAADLLRRRQVPAHLRGWIDSNWGGEDAFLAGGFGAAAVHGDMIAGWSLADCAAGDRTEIGIRTAPEHRRRGLATQVAATAVGIALDRGFREIGWHCDEDNAGSYRTAETSGFTLQRRYHHIVFSALPRA